MSNNNDLLLTSIIWSNSLQAEIFNSSLQQYCSRLKMTSILWAQMWSLGGITSSEQEDFCDQIQPWKSRDFSSSRSLKCRGFLSLNWKMNTKINLRESIQKCKMTSDDLMWALTSLLKVLYFRALCFIFILFIYFVSLSANLGRNQPNKSERCNHDIKRFYRKNHVKHIHV